MQISAIDEFNRRDQHIMRIETSIVDVSSLAAIGWIFSALSQSLIGL